jgi:hypothetical protein
LLRTVQQWHDPEYSRPRVASAGSAFLRFVGPPASSSRSTSPVAPSCLSFDLALSVGLRLDYQGLPSVRSYSRLTRVAIPIVVLG